MLTEEQKSTFNRDGYVVLENFISKEKCKELYDECDNIIESNHFLDEVNKIAVFTGTQEETKVADMYFLTSTDKIRPFLEKRAQEVIDKCKHLENGAAKSEMRHIFNKIGHALHVLNPLFKEVTFSQKTKDIYRSIGYKKPIVCQSMYIFKQPFIGGEVQIHQDGSYLYVEPLKIAGIWIALEDINEFSTQKDCTIENGCLQFIPGSQNTPLARRFIRNPNKEEFDQGKYLVYTDELPEYDEKAFVPVEIKAGDAILIDGLVVHRSSPNFSPKSRNIYTFHVYEGHEATFSSENWMEYSPISFKELYEMN